MGGVRGIGIELQTNQLFVVERNAVHYFQLLPDALRRRNDLHPTVLFQSFGRLGDEARLSFTFDPARFRFDLAAHCRERVAEVATHLRLQRQYALPDVLCSLCGKHVEVDDYTGVVQHHCARVLPPIPLAGTARPKDTGCMLQ